MFTYGHVLHPRGTYPVDCCIVRTCLSFFGCVLAVTTPSVCATACALGCVSSESDIAAAMATVNRRRRNNSTALTRIENIPVVLVCQVHCWLCCAVCRQRQSIMHTIVLATQKGGSGKSTLAIGLAVAAMRDRHRVAIIDADQQATVSNWARRRALPGPRIERADSDVEIERALRLFKSDKYTLAVIDTPATNNYLSSSAIGTADAQHRSQICQAICIRPQPDAAAWLSPQRSSRGVECGRGIGPSVYRPAERPSGCTRCRLCSDRVCSRREGRAGDSRLMAVGLGKTDNGIDGPWTPDQCNRLSPGARCVARWQNSSDRPK